MKSKDYLHLENQLCFALYSASHAMTKVYQPLLERLGVTYPQYLVLLVLWQKDGVMVSELGKELFLDSGTLTPLLKRMEQAGLLRRDRSHDDERQVIVSLTEDGKKLQRKAEEIPKEILCATSSPLLEVLTLTRKLKTLRASLLMAVSGATSTGEERGE